MYATSILRKLVCWSPDSTKMEWKLCQAYTWLAIAVQSLHLEDHLNLFVGSLSGACAAPGEDFELGGLSFGKLCTLQMKTFEARSGSNHSGGCGWMILPTPPSPGFSPIGCLMWFSMFHCFVAP